MKLLAGVGLRLSESLVGPSPDNPDGHFEDADIAAAQQALVGSLDLAPWRPRPDTWRHAARYGETLGELTRVVAREVTRDERVWGFKDPRTCLTWDLWVEAFAAAGARPRPVFCARPAATVVRSLMHSYRMPQDVAEALFLFRTLHALEDVDEPWFFVHYQRWFDDGVAQLGDLAAFCGLATDAARVADVVGSHVRPELNRRSADATVEVSGVLREADRLLEPCVGTSYDRVAIGDWCASVRARVDDFAFLQDALDRVQSPPLRGVPRAAVRIGSRAKRRLLRRLR